MDEVLQIWDVVFKESDKEWGDAGSPGTAPQLRYRFMAGALHGKLESLSSLKTSLSRGCLCATASNGACNSHHEFGWKMALAPQWNTRPKPANANGQQKLNATANVSSRFIRSFLFCTYLFNHITAVTECASKVGGPIHAPLQCASFDSHATLAQFMLLASVQSIKMWILWLQQVPHARLRLVFGERETLLLEEDPLVWGCEKLHKPEEPPRWYKVRGAKKYFTAIGNIK